MKTKTVSRISLITATAAILALGATQGAHAANIWDGGGGNGNWNTANNWDNNAVPTAGQTLTFAGDVQTTTTNDISAAFGFTGINFTNDGTSGKTSSFTVGGLSLTATSAPGITTTAVTSGAGLNDIINLNIAGNNTMTVTTQTLHNLTINGLVSGNRQLTKTGAANTTLTLTNASNSFNNTVNINTGTIDVNSTVGIADAGNVSALGTGAASGAVLKLGNANATGTLNFLAGAASTNRQLTVGNTTAGATGGATINNNGANGNSPLVFTNANFNTAVAGVTATRIITLGGSNTDANAISGIIADNAAGGGIISVTKADSGTWTLSGSNTYTGATTISGGTLKLGASNVFANASTMTLSGGTLNVQTFTDTLGALTLSGNSTISLGLGGALAFADSSAATWGAFTVDLTGFVSGSSLRFGTNNTGLTVGQLGKFTASGLSGFNLDSSGYLTAIPEPSTWALLSLSLTGLVVFRRRRRTE